MAIHGTPRRLILTLAAAPVILFAAMLLFSASVSFAAPNAPAGLLRTAPSHNNSFGSAVAASHLGTVHAIWREPASHTQLKLHRVPCLAPGAQSAGISCFAAATAG
jgi:hypothetical protein